MKHTKEFLESLYEEACAPTTTTEKLTELYFRTTSSRIREAVVKHPNVSKSLISGYGWNKLDALSSNEGYELRLLFGEDQDPNQLKLIEKARETIENLPNVIKSNSIDPYVKENFPSKNAAQIEGIYKFLYKEVCSTNECSFIEKIEFLTNTHNQFASSTHGANLEHLHKALKIKKNAKQLNKEISKDEETFLFWIRSFFGGLSDTTNRQKIYVKELSQLHLAIVLTSILESYEVISEELSIKIDSIIEIEANKLCLFSDVNDPDSTLNHFDNTQFIELCYYITKYTTSKYSFFDSSPVLFWKKPALQKCLMKLSYWDFKVKALCGLFNENRKVPLSGDFSLALSIATNYPLIVNKEARYGATDKLKKFLLGTKERVIGTAPIIQVGIFFLQGIYLLSTMHTAQMAKFFIEELVKAVFTEEELKEILHHPDFAGLFKRFLLTNKVNFTKPLLHQILTNYSVKQTGLKGI